MFLPARRGRFLRSSSYELCLYTGWIVLEETNRMVVYYYFVIVMEIWIWNVTLGLQIRIVGVDLVEMIGKRLIFNLNTTTNR